MADQPLIVPSARKHGVRDDDMLHAFTHPISVDDLDDGFVMYVGAAPDGALLEVGVVDGDDGPVVVHAMPARSKFLR